MENEFVITGCSLVRKDSYLQQDPANGLDLNSYNSEKNIRYGFFFQPLEEGGCLLTSARRIEPADEKRPEPLVCSIVLNESAAEELQNNPQLFRTVKNELNMVTKHQVINGQYIEVIRQKFRESRNRDTTLPAVPAAFDNNEKTVLLYILWAVKNHGVVYLDEDLSGPFETVYFSLPEGMRREISFSEPYNGARKEECMLNFVSLENHSLAEEINGKRSIVRLRFPKKKDIGEDIKDAAREMTRLLEEMHEELPSYMTGEKMVDWLILLNRLNHYNSGCSLGLADCKWIRDHEAVFRKNEAFLEKPLSDTILDTMLGKNRKLLAAQGEGKEDPAEMKANRKNSAEAGKKRRKSVASFRVDWRKVLEILRLPGTLAAIILVLIMILVKISDISWSENLHRLKLVIMFTFNQDYGIVCLLYVILGFLLCSLFHLLFKD